jgi:hypothetical protein
MESMKATSILKCWALVRQACQIDGVDESIEHYEMLGTRNFARHACQNNRMDKISRAFCNARHSHGRLAGNLMDLMNASSILKCSGPQGMLANMMEWIKAASILKCSALTRLACQFDGVEESIEHFEMLGTRKAF